MNRRRGAVLSTLLAALATAPVARATTASVFGIGPRTRAWVGAGASQAAGYEAGRWRGPTCRWRSSRNFRCSSAASKPSISISYGHLPNRRLERQGETILAKGHTFSAGLSLTLSLARAP